MALAERTWERVGERDRARLIESAAGTIRIGSTLTFLYCISTVLYLNFAHANYFVSLLCTTFIIIYIYIYSPICEQNNTRAVNRTCEQFCECDSHTSLSH